MNMKCKKLVLMTMKMNNAHRLTLRITPMKIVNLEMFCNVRIYTIYKEFILMILL